MEGLPISLQMNGLRSIGRQRMVVNAGQLQGSFLGVVGKWWNHQILSGLGRAADVLDPGTYLWLALGCSQRQAHPITTPPAVPETLGFPQKSADGGVVMQACGRR